MSWVIAHLPAWNGWLALLLYWLPMALCAYGYTSRAVEEVQKDRADRARAETEHGFYRPSITLGTLVFYTVMTFFPIANLVAAVFEVAPKVLGDFFEWCVKVLDVPLVPKREKPAQSKGGTQ